MHIAAYFLLYFFHYLLSSTPCPTEQDMRYKVFEKPCGPLGVLIGDSDREPPADHLGGVQPPVGVDDDDVARVQGCADRLAAARALPPTLRGRLE